MSPGRFVLDGYPMTKKQADLMESRSIVPVRVMELQLDTIDVLKRGLADKVKHPRLALLCTLPLLEPSFRSILAKPRCLFSGSLNPDPSLYSKNRHAILLLAMIYKYHVSL